MNYETFLSTKSRPVTIGGFNIDDSLLNIHLFPFQKFILKRAFRLGKYAIFADCGLGKTLMELEFGRQVANYTGKPALILAPPAVVGQTLEEGAKFGIDIVEYMPEMITMNETPSGIYITNYEQLDNINTDDFSCVILDESSILKNFEGATKQLIIERFANTPYKLAATATPSPNDPMELGNHAEFLDVMSRNEMLAMYFVHDGGETSKWRLKGHAKKLFYQFVGSWAIMLSKPSDIGFEDEGYILPGLNFVERCIETEKRDNGRLYNDISISATNHNAELRITKISRLDEVIDIANSSDEQFLISIKQDEEGDYLKGKIPGAFEVRGSQSPEYKKGKLLGFGKKEFRVLITKNKIVQFGMNYQSCHNIIAASIDFSYEALYQLLRRCLRFGQTRIVNLYIITTDTMESVKKSIDMKQTQFEDMQSEMRDAINIDLNQGSLPEMSYDVESEENEYFSIQKGDSFQLIKGIESESIGFTVFSPPFPELYCYSNDNRDLGNCKDYEEFALNFSFLPPELYRVTMEGRNVAIHCMDTPIQKGKHGFIGLRDFSGLIITEMQKAGFIYHSRVTVWKDPVVEMQRTKALGLLHKQIKKDSTMSRVGIPDYILIFRKDGDRENPVKNTDIPVDLWQQYASPVWMDIDQGDTLQGWRSARDNNDEKHICPLQRGSVRRLIHLYTNKGDRVLTTFMGIGTEVVEAVLMDRYGIGFELKASYYDLAKKNARSAVEMKAQATLF